MKIKRLFSATVLTLAAALPLALTAAVPAGASASGAGFRAEVSFNCDNKTSPLCAPNNFGLGGFWASFRFNSDGTGNGQVAFCSHLQGGGPAAGSQHVASVFADLNGQPGWFVGSNGDIWISNETVTFTGRSGGPPVTVFDPAPPYPSDTFVPAAPGHYNTAELLGFTPPPGVSFQVQVTPLSG